MEGHTFSRAVPKKALFARFFASDASGIGLGTIELTGEGGFSLIHQVAFTEDDMSKSSTFRELLSFHKCYTDHAFLASLANSSVLHYTDSYNLFRMFEIGSKRSHLHALLFDIFINLKAFNIHLEVQWLLRSDPTMVLADYFSKSLDTSDWGISEKAFGALSSAWGPFDIDAFASETNKRLSRFFSKLYSQKAEGMNAFAHPWDGLHLWMCPPVPLAAEAIRKLQSSHPCSGVLVVPKWPLASFWWLVFPDGRHFCKGVAAYETFRPKYYSGPAVKSKMFRALVCPRNNSHLQYCKMTFVFWTQGNSFIKFKIAAQDRKSFSKTF